MIITGIHHFLIKAFRIVEYQVLGIFSFFIAHIILRMAITGAGTDRCIQKGCLPLPVHYYSPVPHIQDLLQRKIWSQKSPLHGLNFNQEEQLKFLRKIGKNYGQECQWRLNPSDATDEFTLNNGNFSFGCAVALYCIIRFYRPKNIIEIGSGNSSKIILNAIKQNKIDNGNYFPKYTIIDPFPRNNFKKSEYLTQVIEQKVECISNLEFMKLGDGDILFIDSGHTVKIGSDVNYLILDILPLLASGVMIHFHDIPLPYEYPEIYLTNPRFRMLWTESYLLQAFLCFNNEFEIKLALNSIMTDNLDTFTQIFPQYTIGMEPYLSGSLWIQRK